MYRFASLITASVVLSFLLTWSTGSTEQVSEHESLPTICLRSCHVEINKTATGEFCRRDDNKEIQGRCCVQKAQIDIVFGIDLQSCDLTVGEFSEGIENMTALMYISLEGNNMTALKNTDFNRNSNIKYLSLPGTVNCPGREEMWGHINKSAAGDTQCWDELDPCTVHNVTCPDNSHCKWSGVDLTECLCNDDYHGYKCMNKGTFPTLAFVLGITIPTVVLSALLWVTQRRYVKATDKKK